MLHIVFLEPAFVERNEFWMRHFVMRMSEYQICFFHSQSQGESRLPGMLTFEVLAKPSGQIETVLLPAHAVVGVLVGHQHQTQFGFVHSQEEKSLDHQT